MVGFMETQECAQLNLPMTTWRLARDFALTFHAFWSDDHSEVLSTRADVWAMVAHTTPYRRLPTIADATEELTDIMKYVKTTMPWVSARTVLRSTA